MPIQYINELLGLPELQLHSVLSIQETEVHLEASPVAYKQACPLCHSEEAVKRDGRNTPRKIRHVSIFGKKCFLHMRNRQCYKAGILIECNRQRLLG